MEEESCYEGLDNIELGFDTKAKMSFGRETIDHDGGKNLVVNKMSKVYKKGVVWSRNRD